MFRLFILIDEKYVNDSFPLNYLFLVINPMFSWNVLKYETDNLF